MSPAALALESPGATLPPRIDLDHALLLARRPGDRDRLDRARLMARLGPAGLAHDDLSAAAEAAVLPHLRPLELARAHDLAGRIGSRRVVLLGEPSVVDAVLALAVAAGGELPLTIRSPDPQEISRAEAAGKRTVLVVCVGPSWVLALAHHLAPRFSRILVIEGDGTPGQVNPLPTAEYLRVEGASDARFALLGPLGLALALKAGADLDEIAASVDEQRGRVSRRGMLDNPALLLAALADTAEEAGLPHQAWLLPSARLAPWGAWASAAWAAITAKPKDAGGLREPRGDLPQIILAGDEARVQWLAEGPRSTWTVVLWADEAGADQALASAGSTWGISRAIVGAHLRQLEEHGRPVLRARLSRLDAAAVAGLSVVVLQAALALASMRGLAPLAIPAADRLRQLVAEGSGLAGEGGARARPRHRRATRSSRWPTTRWTRAGMESPSMSWMRAKRRTSSSAPRWRSAISCSATGRRGW